MADTIERKIIAGMEQQMANRAELLRHGAKPLGWKAGLGSEAAKRRLGLDAPLIGFLLDTLRLSSGAEIDATGWVKPALEAEIAIYIGHDMPGGAERPHDAAAAIAALGPAIEVADLNDDVSDVEAMLAGNIYHRFVILGPTDEKRAGGNLEGMRALVRKNGEEIANTAHLETNTGKLTDIVFHAANLLPRYGAYLRAGDVIIAGSLTPPIFCEPGDDLVYQLQPFAPLRVSFAK